MTYELKGTFCTYFETDYVRLDDFPTLESDWGRLLHHLTKADVSYAMVTEKKTHCAPCWRIMC